MSIFFFFLSSPSLCFRVSKQGLAEEMWQWRFVFCFEVIEFSRLSIPRVWIAGCSSGVLPTSRPHISYSGKSYPELTIKYRAELCQKAKQETDINNFNLNSVLATFSHIFYNILKKTISSLKKTKNKKPFSSLISSSLLIGTSFHLNIYPVLPLVSREKMNI